MVYDPTGEPIILRGRGENRVLLPYGETPTTVTMRKEARAVSEMLASTMIGVPGAIRIGNHLLFERLDTDEYGEPVLKRQYVRVVPGNGGRRIFAENWSQHGRFYCWPQNIPSAARATMTINGQPVCEPDFSAMHPTMLYSLLGQKLDGDAYDIRGGFDREEVKMGTVIAINATDFGSAVKALARNKRISHDRSGKIIEAIRERHRPIEAALCADAGIRLMNRDSKISIGTTTGLMTDGIPSIPVHDSIIGSAQYAGQIKARMEESWQRFCGKINPCPIK